MEPEDDKTRTHIVLSKGTMVGHYRIVEKIGAGGMGEVYLAEDTKLKRQVALKFMPVRYQADGETRARFMREAQAAAVLNHTNIVTVHEVGEFNERPFIAMEHCPGRVLRDYRIGKTLSLDDILILILQITEGLQAAHAAGVTHRDLKPSNIVVDEFGKPKLLDFGLAIIRDADRLTKTGSTLGTVGYMSPEQISGKEADHRSDLFSLGVMLYEMIAARRPFTGENDAAVLNSVLKDQPQPLARYFAEVPDELQRIVTKLLEKNKEFRYQSAAEVLSDLKRFMRVETSPRSSSGFSGRQRLLFVGLPALVVLVLIIALSTRLYLPEQEESATHQLMLAVLPFENLGSPEDEYFAEGMSEEITARLAGVHDLGVIARTSTKQYKNTDKPIRQIGEELGVDYILEGTVRWQKSADGPGQVRITPQLIKVADETHIWADVYDEVLTEVFFVQSTIARKVVAALNIALLEPERKSLTVRPTENLEAYDYYLRGLEIYDKFETVSEWLRAGEMFEKAIELDSQFTLAYTLLSQFHSHYYWFGLDQSPERLTEAKKAADRALELVPDLPEAHLALGYYYYYGRRDLDRALQEFEIALEQAPNNSELLAATSYIRRRLGDWDESYDQQKRAIELDPASLNKRLNFAGTLVFMRRFEEAELCLNHNISLFPDYEYTYSIIALLYLAWRGDVEKAREVLRSVPEHVSNISMLAHSWRTSDLFAGDYDPALARDLGRVDTMHLAVDSAWYYDSHAETHYLAGNQKESRIYYDSTRVCLETLQQRKYRITGFLPPSLGVVYAGLGRKEDAIRAAREAVAQLPLSEDAYLGSEPIRDLALTYVRVGEYDLAIDELDHLLSVPSDMTVAWLRHHPNWEPLRDHPRFQALLEKYE